MAYRVDTQGDENYCLQLVTLESGEYLPDKLWNVASYVFHEPPDADVTGAPLLGITTFKFVARISFLAPGEPLDNPGEGVWEEGRGDVAGWYPF